jgi:hypothetical protein
MLKEVYLHIRSVVPDAQWLLTRDAEDLAVVFLQCVNAMPQKYKDAMIPEELIEHSDINEYPIFYQGGVKKALMEAWMYLENDGFVAPLPNEDQDRYFITRKGQRVM